MANNKYKPWTEDETNLCFDLKRKQGWTEAAIAKHLGRTTLGIIGRLRVRKVVEPDIGQESSNPWYPWPPGTPPPEVQADRLRRTEAEPVSLTAAMCGDPAPGQSALDRRRLHIVE